MTQARLLPTGEKSLNFVELGLKDYRSDPLVFLPTDLAKLKIRFRSPDLVRCFGENSWRTVACGDWFLWLNRPTIDVELQRRIFLWVGDC